ncbi:MAG: hypothetical protein ACXWQO_18490 [Bdellovibrionota bacterium]
MRICFSFLVFFISFSAFAEDPVPAQSPRDATPAELIVLAKKVAKEMHTCAIVRRNKAVAVALMNGTEDYIDKEPIEAVFTKALKLKPKGPKIMLNIELSSAKSVKDEKFASTYTMTARYLQGKKKFCEKSVSFTKSGNASAH